VADDAGGEAEHPWQADPALEVMRYPLDRLSGWSLAFETAGQDELREGSTWLRDRRIVVYVRPSWTAERTANALAHEVGHAHDVTFLSRRARSEYLRLRGLTWAERHVTVGWAARSKQEPRKRQPAGCEDFAEVFAIRWAPPAEFQATLRPQPTPEELPRLDGFLTPP
jgi:hypothetical protein